ncbi:hypothetical protein GALMADRAFT_144370 [Galerina marginata CBS 339.88]|uniref:Nephrocystin 3-like N-terminal domain-containing protein n=1 Tax=Galerina marginata (strain CBS 339.88) TaxID=685588 RepID=A0A067SIY6_GALM3|nr:hypothetical protein GALMADRAFT_144370 [Galerina marginata CBS 339.88]
MAEPTTQPPVQHSDPAYPLLETDLQIFKAVHVIEEGHRRSLLKDLQPSDLADHKYHLEGEKKEVLRRAVCTHSTREHLLNNIIAWAKETSSETIYWLFSPAGMGKTTIAYTIVCCFELATSEDTIVLGGNFLCSQQFEETRFVTCIIHMIIYHLALRCKAFADALTHSRKLDTINQNLCTQLDGLLIGPWQASESARLADLLAPPEYIIVIDALDEIDGAGGSEFLRDLLNVINENCLNGLKFFATSWPDPNLVAHVGSFADKQLYHLEVVLFEEAQADISTYLNASLRHGGDKVIKRVVAAAAGLFIYASTVVKYIGKHTPLEQRKLLKKLFPVSIIPEMLPGATALLDELYIQILLHAFGEFDRDIYLHRLHILFTFLCTSECTSTSIVTGLLTEDSNTDPDSSSVSKANSAVSEMSIADDILQRLYVVLYTENNKVLWYHKSFPDFFFDQNQSKTYWCDRAEHHQRLMASCFRVMKEGLQFNIANIKSSFVFDCDNTTLLDAVTNKISSTLSCTCQNWDQHFFSTALPALNPISYEPAEVEWAM